MLAGDSYKITNHFNQLRATTQIRLVISTTGHQYEFCRTLRAQRNGHLRQLQPETLQNPRNHLYRLDSVWSALCNFFTGKKPTFICYRRSNWCYTMRQRTAMWTRLFSHIVSSYRGLSSTCTFEFSQQAIGMVLGWAHTQFICLTRTNYVLIPLNML